MELANPVRVVYQRHPLLHTARDYHQLPATPGQTVQQALDALGIHLAQLPVELSLDGALIARDDWADTPLRDGQLLHIHAALADGGGLSDQDAKTLRVIATLAVVIAAPYAGAALFNPGTLGASITTGLLQLGGLYLVNTLIPAPEDDDQDDAGSPTYALAGGSNRARHYAPLPLIFGQHRVFPDYGAKPFTEFLGSDQWLFQVFNFGLSDVTLSDFKIGDNPLANFGSMVLANDLEISDSTGALSLFPGNVDTALPGATIDYQFGTGGTAAEWTPPATASAASTRLVVEVSGVLYRLGNNGDLRQTTTGLSIQYRAAGTSDPWTGFPGDPGLPGYYVRQQRSRRPVRWAFSVDVDPSTQYEVRIKATEVLLDGGPKVPTSAVAALVFAQLRSYQPDGGDYNNQQRVALRIRATGQLNGAVARFNALASAQCEVWTGSAWVTQATSNPAWWFRWFAIGKNDAGGRPLFGGRQSDATLDLDAIKAWGAWCDSNALTFNYVHDGGGSVHDLLLTIARAGRATPTRASGKLGVVFDQENQPAAAVFGMSNIIRDSFQVSYITEDLPDEIVMQFINPDLAWQPDTVRALVPGTVTPQRSIHLRLPGCTNLAMAAAAANLLAAEQLYRRRRISFDVEFEHLPVQRGDVVLISHDLTAWDYAGRLVSGATTTDLMLDRAVPFTPATSHYIGIRYPDGSWNVYDVVYQAGSSATIELSPGTPLPSAPDSDPNGHPACDYLWFFAAGSNTPGKPAKVVDIRLKSDSRATIICTDEDPNYYLAEANAYTHNPVTPTADTPAISNLAAADTVVRAGGGYQTRISVAWDSTGEYGGAIIRAGYVHDGQAPDMEERGRTFARSFEFYAHESGTVAVEVTVLNERGEFGPGGTATVQHSIVGKAAPPADVAGLTLTETPTGLVVSWSDNADADLSHYIVKDGADWATAAVLDSPRVRQINVGFLSAGVHTIQVAAVDTSGNESATPSSQGITVAAPSAVSPSVTFEGGDLRLAWAAPGTGSWPVAAYRISFGPAFASSTEEAHVDALHWRTRAAFTGTRKYWVAPIDAAGNLGAEAGIDVTISAPGAPTITAQVVDNNVMLTWSATAGTLPIARYEIRRGAVFASATVLGAVSATFKAILEQTSGDFTYWVAPIDTADNYGTEASKVVSVAEPPDFALQKAWQSTFGGTLTSAIVKQDGHLLAPVVTGRTWAQHFTDNAWTTIQAQITAGYPLFIQPAASSAQYAEEFDAGAVIPSTHIKVTHAATTVAGSVTITPTLSVKKLSGDPWTDYAGVWELFASDFQYVKVTLDFSPAVSGTDLVEVTQLDVELSVKLKGDSGSGSAVSTDATGTTVSFNKSFIDIEAIIVTPLTTSAVHAVVNFVDAPNPTDFKVLLYDTSGTRVSGDFSWTARGY